MVFRSQLPTVTQCVEFWYDYHVQHRRRLIMRIQAIVTNQRPVKLTFTVVVVLEKALLREKCHSQSVLCGLLGEPEEVAIYDRFNR